MTHFGICFTEIIKYSEMMFTMFNGKNLMETIKLNIKKNCA